MRFLVDAQLTVALARLLAAKGHDAEHVADRGMQSASDAAIWDHALAASAAIVTKDEDFAQRKVLIDNGPVVIWIRLPNTRRAGSCSRGSRRRCRLSSRRWNAATP
jgi:predicted nuclease of predicted toxin-antitoxin system